MRLFGESSCFVKGTDAQPACKVPEGKGQHAEKLHETLTSKNIFVNAMECKEEDDEEEGCINVVAGRI